MVRPQHFFVDAERAQFQRFRFRKLSHAIVKRTETNQRCGGVGGIRARSFFANRESALVKRL